MDGWLREAYFGQLLDDHPRAIRVFDTFPVMHAGEPVLYCLALEYARHGDLSAFLQHDARRWSETLVRREIAGILEVLGKLHRGQLLHRDLTPMNVFVCDNRRLKLGDFGIVRQQSDRRGITAQNDEHADGAERDPGRRRRRSGRRATMCTRSGSWSGMLVRGDAQSANPHLRRPEARLQRSSEGDRPPVHRRAAQAVRQRAGADRRAPRATSPAARRRRAIAQGRAPRVHRHPEQAPARRDPRGAARAGAIVHGGPSSQTTVVVRGRPNAQQAAGRDAGLKLMEIKRLREKGHRITLLNEAQFWRLVARR